MADATFGIVLRGSGSASQFREVVRRAEDCGCDVLAAPAHEELAAGREGISAGQLLDTPFALLARDASHAREIIAATRGTPA